MQIKNITEGDWIMEQGDDGDYFYVFEYGEAAFYLEEKIDKENSSSRADNDHTSKSIKVKELSGDW